METNAVRTNVIERNSVRTNTIETNAIRYDIETNAVYDFRNKCCRENSVTNAVEQIQ
jgi:hypothetical protein